MGASMAWLWAFLLPLQASARTCVVGGITQAGVYQASTECYDTNSLTWTLDNNLNLPIATSHLTPFLKLDGTLCVAGGLQNGGVATNQVLCLNPSSITPSWVPDSALPTARYGMAVMYYPAPYLMGGNTSSGAVTTTGYMYNTGSWAPVPSLTTPRHAALALLFSSTWCVYGGLGDSSPMNSVECWDGNSWSAAPPNLSVAVGDAPAFQIGGQWCIGGGQDNGFTVATQCADGTGFFSPNTNYNVPSDNLVGNFINLTLNSQPCLANRVNLYCFNGTAWNPSNLAAERFYGAAFTYVPRPPTPAPTTFAPTTRSPTRSPTTNSPTMSPTRSPTTSSPTLSPTTLSPTTKTPTTNAPKTMSPTMSPTKSPTTFAPTTSSPTKSPTTLTPTTASPTTYSPTLSPTTSTPTNSPVITPTTSPTAAPSPAPTSQPTLAPTSSPTTAPTSPTFSPTQLAQAWWGVDYPTTLVTNQWTTFTITGLTPPVWAPSPLPSITWLFAMTAPNTTIPSAMLTSQFTASAGSPLRVPPYTFVPGASYIFQTQVGTVHSIWLPFTLTVTPLVVSISGGNRDVLSNSSVFLDARGSYDPDQNPASPSQLSYAWTLTNCLHVQIIGSSIQSTLSLSTGAPETSCIVNLTLSAPGKTTQSFTTIRVLSRLVCNVSISGPSFIAVSDTLRLLASITGISSSDSPLTKWQWAATPSIPASSSSTCALPPSNSPNSRALSLGPLCLQEGVIYQFSFTTGNALGNTQAWFAVQLAARPSGGKCDVSPQVGVAVITPFVVNCSGWQQTGPVSVSLSYALGVNTSGNNLALSPSQSQPTLMAFLSQSPVGGTRLLVYIYGYGGAVTTYLVSPVTVQPESTCPLLSLLTAQGTLPSPVNYPALGQLTAAWQQFLAQTTTQCTIQVQNASWVMLWSRLQEGIAASGKTGSQGAALSFLASAFGVAIKTVPTSLAKAAQTRDAYLRQPMLYMVDFFANNTGGSPLVAERIIALGTLMFPLLTGSCAESDHLAESLAAMVRTATAGNLPSDPALSTSDNGLSVTSAFFFGTDPGTESLAASQVNTGSNVVVNLPSTLVSQGGEVSALTITQYLGVRDPACRASKGGLVPATGSIVDISLSSRSGELVGVSNVKGGFSFLMPVSESQLCGNVQCSWWNPTTGDWNATGCTGSLAPDNSLSYLCTCTHLTEFSLLMSPVVCSSFRAGYLTMMSLYAVLEAVVIVKLIMRCSKDHSKGKKSLGGAVPTIVWQHVLIALLITARIIACASLGSPRLSQGWGLPARAVTLVVPYLVMFWIYTLMVFQWASLFHLGMKYKLQSFSQVRWLFFACNLVVCAAIIALLISLSTHGSSSSSSSLSSQPIVVGATATLAGVTFVVAIAFFLYALLITRSMQNATHNSNSHSQGPVTNNGPLMPFCCTLSLKQKIVGGAVVVSALLCLQSIMHVVSVVSSRGPVHLGSPVGAVAGDQSELVVLAADWTCLVVLVLMYHKAMHDSTGEKSREARIEMAKPEVSHRSTRGSTRTLTVDEPKAPQGGVAVS